MKHLTSSLFLLLCSISFSVNAVESYMGLDFGLYTQDAGFQVIDQELHIDVGITEVQEFRAPSGSELNYLVYLGYGLSKDLFLELGYARNQEMASGQRLMANGKSAIEETSSRYYYIAYVGVWPVRNNLAWTARAGLSVWSLEYNQDIIDSSLPVSDPKYRTPRSYSDSSPGILVGLGLSYDLNPNLEFRVNYSRHWLDFSYVNVDVDYTADIITIGMLVHF